MYKLNTPVIALILTTALTGCATGPDTGNKIRSYSDSAKTLGDTWDKGNEMAIKGNKLIEKGKEQISDGKANMEKGTDMVEQGKTMMTESEIKFDKLLLKKTVEN